ncbi:elongation factor P maturation arginine rhamnosyltransferase EarP [Limnobacter humi]|uniref:Protein-arginine rhamnosyltransferase n=1 Tax=Limnobacter humi TaxID=1778671 RepID=A0ABT1WBC6_9BURK|nr:elongation factor P maturation arginine rhamnosyltransferase EarP [Limnobacter humi]MCQ8894823.1 elongation factor P maturation arginine rhamnosyltransferase EarP [Limnobacter humi]
MIPPTGPTMRHLTIVVVCKVIDNLGDAGFCLRLSRRLATLGHSVVMLHDAPATLALLYPTAECSSLLLIDARSSWQWPTNGAESNSEPDLILEPFGTSSHQTQTRFDNTLKTRFPKTPWLLIDYLSAESWIEDFHLRSSVEPSTGHRSTYFYPGFTAQTGGIVHGDFAQSLWSPPAVRCHRIFVFAYPHAPLDRLINHATQEQAIVVSGRAPQDPALRTRVQMQEFVPQSAFDALLLKHDLLFVRGEDSFVRAQLAGRPMIWQIYPTDDQVHLEKLAEFFNLYAKGLPQTTRDWWWQLWRCWNGAEPVDIWPLLWSHMEEHWPVLCTHSQHWQQHLLNGPELVKEVLTWVESQAPTNQQ